MKKVKKLRIASIRLFVDGKEIKQGDPKPTKGKVVYCKMEGYLWLNDGIPYWEVSSDGRATCRDDEPFNFEQGKDIAILRAKRGLVTTAMNALNEYSGKLLDETTTVYDQLRKVHDYLNFELLAIGARKDNNKYKNPNITIAEKRLFNIMTGLGKMSDDDIEHLLKVLENEGFI